MPSILDFIRETLRNTNVRDFPQSGAGNLFAGIAGGYQAGERRAQGTLLSDIARRGISLSQTPEELPAIPPISLGPYGQTMGFQGGQNPAYQRIMGDIIGASERFSRLGGDPNKLLEVLKQVGVVETPQERVARETTKRQTDLQQKSFDFQQEQLKRKQKFQDDLLTRKQGFEEKQNELDRQLRTNLERISSGKSSNTAIANAYRLELSAWRNQIEKEYAEFQVEEILQGGKDLNQIPTKRQWMILNGYADPSGRELLPEHLQNGQAYNKWLNSLTSGPTTTPTTPDNSFKGRFGKKEK